MTQQRILLVTIAAMALVGTTLPCALAGDYYEIILANRIIGRLRDAGPYGSVSARGAQVEKNIVEALSVEDVGTPKLWTKLENGLPSIYIGGTFLVQVRPGDVAGKGISTRALAGQWLTGFKQQFPRAEPVTKMGGSGGGGAAAGGGSSGPAPPPKKQIVVPEEDRQLVTHVQGMMADARALEDEDFSARANELATEVTTLIWHSEETATCDRVIGLDGADKAVHSALNGIKYLRDLSDEAFEAKKTVVAYTVVKRVRAALGSAS